MTLTVAVRERPILFSSEMVRAILDGRKTQTRRVMKPQPVPNGTWNRQRADFDCLNDHYPPSATLWKGGWLGGDAGELQCCPFGVVGDRLWVRETWAARGKHTDRYQPKEIACNRSHFEIWHAADCYDAGGGERFNLDFLGRWRPSIHMPRWASRITLEITDVRVERLQGISEADAIAEGCFDEKEHDGSLPTQIYRQLWDSLNASRGYGWDVNPWVWCLSFRRLES